ncbi:P-loop containing nucleoside triphosphate hydrolase protein [Lipomyces oligophaga]|uniref:P-loop containing nucleoside triphosphate hydrolase protein n=1 Tax=Lipomyces oligophaga TaxID=45792 RepID=UPI0034CE1D44
MSDSDSDYDISGAIAGLNEDDNHNDTRSKGSKIPSLQVNSSSDSDSDDADFFKNINSSSGNLNGEARKKIVKGPFAMLGLSQILTRNVHRKGFSAPTPIQRKTIPLVVEGADVVGMARTGSGKTAAFVLPMIDKLKTHSAKVGARALILSPSRELALQTLKVVKEFSRGTDLKSVLLVGGDSLEEQFGWLMTNPDIIVATPGRFAHLKVEMDLDLRSMEYVVFDEADRLFEMGFAMQLTSILASLPSTRQTLLFSATLPKSLVEFARAGLTDPVLVRLDADSKISENLEMFFFSIKSAETDGALVWLLQDIIKMPNASQMPKPLSSWKSLEYDSDEEHNANGGESDSSGKKKNFKGKKQNKFTSKVPQGNELISPHSTIVFVPTRHHVEYVTSLLRSFNYAVSYIYGSLDQFARRDQLAQFRAGYSSILVVTDVAARGIDIPILSNVINYTFPGSPKVLVHRVGRTARAGKRGRAFSLIKETELPYLLDLELFLGKSLQLPSDFENIPSSDIDYTKGIIIGSFPRDDLERSCEDVQNLLAKDGDLRGLQEVAVKGEKLYLKTRGSASSESVKRAKEVVSRGWNQLNPMYKEAKIADRETMLARLSNFRPSETIFELTRKGGIIVDSGAELMKRRRRQIAPIQRYAKEKKVIAVPEDINLEGTEMKSLEHLDQDRDNEVNLEVESEASEDEIQNIFKLAPERRNSAKRKQSSDETESQPQKKTKATSFRDNSHYISHYAATEAAQDRAYGVNKTHSSTSVTSFMDSAASATFDLVGDESRSGTGIVGSNRTKLTKWDKKRHKYVTRPSGDEATMGGKKGKMIRGENGVRLPASYKSGRFENWKAAHKRRDGVVVGQRENPHDAGAVAIPTSRKFKHKDIRAPKPADKLRDDYHAKRKRLAAAANSGHVTNAKSEVRSSEHIRKARNEKERRREKNARPSRKGRGRK